MCEILTKHNLDLEPGGAVSGRPPQELAALPARPCPAAIAKRVAVFLSWKTSVNITAGRKSLGGVSLG